MLFLLTLSEGRNNKEKIDPLSTGMIRRPYQSIFAQNNFVPAGQKAESYIADHD